MSQNSNNTFRIVFTVIVVLIAISAVFYLINHIVPILIILALGYGAYAYVSRKALGGGRKTLP